MSDRAKSSGKTASVKGSVEQADRELLPEDAIGHARFPPADPESWSASAPNCAPTGIWQEPKCREDLSRVREPSWDCSTIAREGCPEEGGVLGEAALIGATLGHEGEDLSLGG